MTTMMTMITNLEACDSTSARVLEPPPAAFDWRQSAGRKNGPVGLKLVSSCVVCFMSDGQQRADCPRCQIRKTPDKSNNDNNNNNTDEPGQLIGRKSSRSLHLIRLTSSSSSRRRTQTHRRQSPKVFCKNSFLLPPLKSAGSRPVAAMRPSSSGRPFRMIYSVFILLHRHGPGD